MTTRHRQKLAQLFAPKPVFADNRYGVHALDNTADEILPRYHRDAAIDDVWLTPAKSEAVQALSILISSAQARTLVDAPIEVTLDLRGFCEDAELSPQETDILVLAGDGWKQVEIASWLEVNQATVSRHLSTARAKLAGWLPLEVVHKLAVA